MKNTFKKFSLAGLSLIFALLLSLSASADAPYWWKTERPFPNYTAENPPRVVDDGDFLTAEQESVLSSRIEAMCEKYNFSYVLFTDTDIHEDLTDYYYEKADIYAADFLYFNGYGIGDDYSATVFFHYIIHDENGELVDRGWTTISTGDNEHLFTESRINEFDDIVEPYFISEDYYSAYLKHIECVENMLSDIYDIPEWYPEGINVRSLDRSGRTYGATIDMSLPHVIDNAGLLTASQAISLEKTIREAIEKTGKDIVIFTDTSSHSLYLSEYGSDYYYYNGYYRDGIILTVIKDGYGATVGTVGFGEGKKTADSQIDARLIEDWNESSAETALKNYVKNAKFGLKHDGRMPMKGSSVVAIVIISLLVGLIFAGIRNSSLMKGMKLTPPVYAARYLRQGSLAITNRQDAFLYRTVTKVARPRDTGSSSRGGGGHSSYGGGHSSGGGHFSGGGRHY